MTEKMTKWFSCSVMDLHIVKRESKIADHDYHVQIVVHTDDNLVVFDIRFLAYKDCFSILKKRIWGLTNSMSSEDEWELMCLTKSICNAIYHGNIPTRSRNAHLAWLLTRTQTVK